MNLPIWVVYWSPPAFPEHWVLRCQRVQPDGSIIHDPYAVVAPTLAEARAAVPPGLHRMDRMPGDAPAIVETWL